MKKNIPRWDRTLRLLFGTSLIAYGIAGGPIWSFIGVYFLITGSWGYSPLYWFLKINAPQT